MCLSTPEEEKQLLHPFSLCYHRRDPSLLALSNIGISCNFFLAFLTARASLATTATATVTAMAMPQGRQQRQCNNNQNQNQHKRSYKYVWATPTLQSYVRLRACRRAWRNVWRSCLSWCGTSLEILLDSSTGEIDFSPGPFLCSCVSFHQWAHLEASQNSGTLLEPKHCQASKCLWKGDLLQQDQKVLSIKRTFNVTLEIMISDAISCYSYPNVLALIIQEQRLPVRPDVQTENYSYSNLISLVRSII